MKSSITLNDLILFALNDTLDSDEDHCSGQIKTAASVAQEWKCIFESDPWEEQADFSVVNLSVGLLLAYSRALQVFNTKSTGAIFKLMN